jgi:hypothetical protein
MYFLRTTTAPYIASATSVDGLTWVEDGVVCVSTLTLPTVFASTVTGASVITLGSGFRMLYSIKTTGGLYGIVSATSVDGLSWTNEAGFRIQLSSGTTFVGSPSAVPLSNGTWAVYFMANTNGAADAANRAVFYSISSDQGANWASPALALSANATAVSASVLTDGRVRLYLTQTQTNQSSATVVVSALAPDVNGTSFAMEAGVRYSTSISSGWIADAVAFHSTDTFRWRLYFEANGVNLIDGPMSSAITAAPAPTAVTPASYFNTSSSGAVTLSGEIFSSPDPTALLRTAGQPDIPVFSLTRVSDLSLTGSVNVLGAVPGRRDLVVTNADGQTTTLASAFLVDFPGGDVRLINNLLHPGTGAPTSITITTFDPGVVRARIFTIDGRLVTTLHDVNQPAGTLLLSWDGRDASGAAVASGLYILHVSGPKLNTRQKIVLVR